MRYGVEYESTPDSWATFFAALKAAGRDFCVREISRVTAAELTAAASAGVDHVFVWNTSATRALAGSAAGAADATAALAALTALSVTTTCPVYYACESDVLGSAADDYYQGLATVVPVAQIGAYAPWRVLDYLVARSRITYGCQLRAWPHGHGWHASAALRQTQADYPIGGLVCEKHEAVLAAFGQYRSGAGVESAAPSTVPMAFLTAVSPHGLVIPWGRKDTDLIMRIKDEDGKEMEYRGTIRRRVGGIAPHVTCEDLSATWDKIVCEWVLDYASVGTILQHVIEDPTGGRPTGVVCHIDEPRGADNKPIMLKDWSGNGKTVSTILGEFSEMTGCRWALVSIGGVWHFYFGHPANWPEWDSLRDDVAGDTPGTERRVLNPSGELGFSQTNEGFGNRVNFTKTIEPPSLPTGMSDWGEVWSEAAATWKNYGNGVAISEAPPAPGHGSSSIKFVYSYTAPVEGAAIVPSYVDLGYVAVPGPLCDFSTWYWGWLSAQCKCWVTTDQGITDRKKPRSIVNLAVYLHSGAYPGTTNVSGSQLRLAPNRSVGWKWTLNKWQIYGKAERTENESGGTLFDPTNVRWLQFRAECANPKGYTALTAGHTWTLEVRLDGIKPIGATAAKDAPTTSESFVEAQAVTDGDEQPIPMTIQDMTLPYQDAEALAALCLTEHYRTRNIVGPLKMAGMADIPILSRLPLELASIGVTDVSYAPVSIAHEPFKDTTEISLGDAPYDEAYADAVIRRMFDRTRAQSA
jgi:hypothetical protein